MKAVGLVARGEQGCLRIGLSSPLGPGFVAELLALHRQERPGVDIEITEGRACEIVRLIREGRLDIAFVAGEHAAGDCHSRALWTEALVIAVPADHAVARVDQVTWADLSEAVFIIRQGGADPQAYDHAIRRLSDMGHHPRISRLNVSRDTGLQMVAQGYGVTLTTDAMAMVAIPGVVFRTIVDEPEPIRFSAVWSPHNQGQALRDFLGLAQRMSLDRLSAPCPARQGNRAAP